MAEFVKTRDAVQCRSHHIKQLRSTKSIQNIINKVKNIVGENEYKALLEEFKVLHPARILTSRVVRESKKKRKR